jgi:Trp operon repressor
MQTKEFVRLVKVKFDVMPTTRELNKFIFENRLTVNTTAAHTATTKAYLREDSKKIKPSKEKIIELMNNNWKHEAIAKELFISKSTLSDYKREYGLTSYRVSKGDRIEKIMELIRKDMDASEIAKIMNVSVNTVCRYRRCSGITQKVVYKVDIERMKELLKTHNQREVAKILGVSETCICNRIKACRKNGEEVIVVKGRKGIKKKVATKEEILNLVKEGYNTNKKIIDKLGISEKTYIRIKKELGITSYEG